MVNWHAWKFDFWTAAWLVWILCFFVLEAWTLLSRSHNELTAHLRPLIQSVPLAWFLFLGVWCWVLIHFFVQGMAWKTLFRVG